MGVSCSPGNNNINIGDQERIQPFGSGKGEQVWREYGTSETSDDKGTLGRLHLLELTSTDISVVSSFEDFIFLNVLKSITYHL